MDSEIRIPAASAVRPAGLIIRQKDPNNLEMPFENLNGFITPTPSFYVRTHYPVPKIDKASWKLRIEGEVERPFDIGYAHRAISMARSAFDSRG